FPILATCSKKGRDLSLSLDQIRRDGYYVDVDETFVGFTAISVPVWSSTGEVAAAIGVAGPSFKLEGETREKIIQLAKETAANISRRLGYVDRRVTSSSGP